MTITDQQIKSALKACQAEQKAVTLKDPGHRGSGRLALQLRPFPSGPLAEWYAIYYRHGRRRQQKLGTYPDMKLKDARAKYKNHSLPDILDGKELRPISNGAAGPGTVQQLFQAYIDQMKAAGKKSWKEYERALITGKDSAAKALGKNRAAADVTPDDVSRFLGRVHGRGAASHADHLRSYMRAAFQWGLDAANDYTRRSTDRWHLTANPVAVVPRDGNASKQGKRHLDESELKDFWCWLEGKRTPAAGVLKLMICTGQRVTELNRCREAMFNPDEKLMTWDDTKNGMPHVLPLPDLAVTLIAGMSVSTAGLYFPQRWVPDQPVTMFTVQKVCQEYCDEKKVTRFSPRDLRRTWKTLTGMVGIAKEMRDRLQNHALHDVSSKHYDKYEYLREKREAMALWQAWLDKKLADQSLGTSPATEQL